MSLIIQIKTLLFSILYGFIFSLLLSLLYKYVLKLKKYNQIIFSCLYALINAITYFYILLRLNYGILHPYYIIGFILGFIIERLIIKAIIVLFKKKWYNNLGESYDKGK